MIYTELFSGFFRIKICWLETNIYKIEHYNLIGMVILSQNLLSNVNAQLN